MKCRVAAAVALRRHFSMLIGSMASFNNRRSTARSEAIRAALQKRRQGRRRWWGGTLAPYGYRLAADGETVLQVEAEQVVIRQLRRWRKAGRSFRSLAADLGRRGIPTKSGAGPWHAAQIQKILAR